MIPSPVDPLTVNLHTHTWRCKHAQGDALDYARMAVAAGLNVLGFSDHTPLPDGRWAEVRMGQDEVDDYRAAIDAARGACPHLRLLAGLECEPGFGYEGFYRDELLGRHGLDYLIAGVHWIPDLAGAVSCFTGLDTTARLAAYVTIATTAMASGLFVCLAHPDIFGWSRDTWTSDCTAAAEDLAAAALATGCPLELNSYGIRRPWRQLPGETRPAYPWPPFWDRVARVSAPVVLGSDAHQPDHVPHAAEVLAMARDCRLRLVDPLPGTAGTTAPTVNRAR